MSCDPWRTLPRRPKSATAADGSSSILHVAPESYVGGPLAFVETGDDIEVDADARRIHLHVSNEELARRRAAWRPPAPRYPRGYGAMYAAHIGQADEGCDFDFLLAGEAIAEPEIH